MRSSIRMQSWIATVTAVAASLATCNVSHAADVYGGIRYEVDLGDIRGFVLAPPTPGPEGKRPWIWYAPVLGNNPGKQTEWMLRQLFEKGYYVVGVNVGESQGNPAGRRGYSDFYKKIVPEFKLEPKARLLAQSRGGLMLYNWAVENPEKVQCIAGIYPACDLRSYPRIANAAKAYGMTVEQMEATLKEHNPVDRVEPLAKAGVPILHIHGDSDKLVPLDANSGELQKRYRALGGTMEIITVPGIGHTVVPEFFQEPRMVEFLLKGGF